MQKVLTAAQMREVDRLTTERYGIPSILLMENAAHAVARVITEKLGGSVKDKRVIILCGKGNNGGDGAALARILWTQGANCFVYLAGRVQETKGDARTNFEIVFEICESTDANWPNSNCLYITEMDDGKALDYVSQWQERESDCFVDALFGTGLSKPIEGDYRHFVDALSIRRRSLPAKLLLSIDLPSGNDADGWENQAASAIPDITVTFTAPKPINILAPSYRRNGEVIVADIGSPKGLIEDQASELLVAEFNDALNWLRQAKFSFDSYKNRRGHSMLIVGSEDYSGAAVLSGNAAMRSGVGLVTLACPANAKQEIASRLLPDVILSTFGSENFDDLLGKADSIAVGCGLDANDEGIEKLVRGIVENRTRPIIIDAGALWFFNPPNGLLQKPFVFSELDRDAETAYRNVRVPLILTPHEGEFMRLLGTDGKNAIKDRVAAVRNFSRENNVILVLKGERVLIGHPDGRVVVNPTGNSGLGKAGNGDTLTGILAGFVAQATAMEIDIFETVVAAVYIAGLAGDIAEKKYGKRVMTASDVRECMADAFGEFDIMSKNY